MIKKILIAFLLLLFCWAIYLMQVDPEAEAFFYSYPGQEKINKEINNWLNNKPVKIPLVGDVDRFTCWLNKKRLSSEAGDACPTNEELREFISQNQILLDKYQLYKKDPEESELLSGQTLLDGHRLFVANLYLISLKGSLEDVLNLLVEDDGVWRKKLQSESTGWVEFALNMVHQNLNRGVLFDILITDRNFTKPEYLQLKNLLTPINVNDIDIKKILRGEFELLKMTLPTFRRKEHQVEGLFTGSFINHVYENVQTFLKDTRLPFSELCAASQGKNYQDQYSLSSNLTKFFKYGPTSYKTSIFFDPYISTHNFNLFLYLHELNVRRKLLGFIVLLKEKNISSSQIITFIKDNPDLATNPLTGNLFGYDQEEKKISIDATECSEPWSISLSNFN